MSIKDLIDNSVKEFDKLTNTIDCPDELYGKDSATEWLKNNKTLYSDEVYGEPMFDLDEDKVKQFLTDQIEKAVEETIKEDIEIIKKHRPVFFKGDLHSLLSQDEVMTVREVLRIEILEEMGIDCSEMRLSIQSKEK
ncbi:MAG: hypothetical protein KKH92_00070 [Firmicutes bacterium]|nr:hypothetical protein [Bacillota bacterium]